MKLWLCVMLSMYSGACSATGFIFAHGLGGDKEQVRYYTKHNGWYILSDPVYSFNFPEVLSFGRIDTNKVSMAQEDDIKALEKAYNEFFKDYQHCKYVVPMGISRGASAIITYLATKQPKNVKAAVLEAPFDTLEALIEHYTHSYLPHQKEELSLVWSFPLYKKDGIKPLDVVDKIDKNIPLLLIHSLTDQVIPAESSRRLYQKLKESGHKDVYLLILPEGTHANYQHGKFASLYQSVVHAFFKKYGIAHDPSLALKGEKSLLHSKEIK